MKKFQGPAIRSHVYTNSRTVGSYGYKGGTALTKFDLKEIVTLTGCYNGANATHKKKQGWESVQMAEQTYPSKVGVTAYIGGLYGRCFRAKGASSGSLPIADTRVYMGDSTERPATFCLLAGASSRPSHGRMLRGGN